MNLKEIIKSVRRIELKAKSFSNQNFSGLDQSASKGLGMNFSEVREYHLGDETRFIDWNVTARLNNAHVKVFEEEREHVNMFFTFLWDEIFNNLIGKENSTNLILIH